MQQNYTQRVECFFFNPSSVLNSRLIRFQNYKIGFSLLSWSVQFRLYVVSEPSVSETGVIRHRNNFSTDLYSLYDT